MTKKHSTKRALFSSVIALLVCFTMLVGTTFAWFTDSVTSSGNVIKAGKLDVGMYWADGTKAVPAADSADWVDASAGAIFDYDKWEPGYVQVRHIRIANEGTLALKYKVDIIANGAVSELAEVIDVYYVDPAIQVADRTALIDDYKLGTLKDALANLGATGNGTLEAGAADTITIAFKMQETAGNEYQGKSIGTDFSIQLLATQLASEEDSFDDQYDVDSDYIASVSTAEELNAALALGGNIILKNDITVADGKSLVVPEGVTANLDLNDNTITNPVVGAPALINNGTLTIDGNGAIVNGTNSTSKSHTVRNYGTLTVNGGYIGTDDTAGAAIINDGDAVINGGTFASKQENTKSDGLCAYVFINNGQGTLTINDATFNGQTHGLFGAYAGKLIVNGGTYNMDGNGGLGCYVVYATGSAEVVLAGGTVNTNEPRNGNVFYVYNSGNLFNGAAVNTGNITYTGTQIYLNGVLQSYTDTNA